MGHAKEGIVCSSLDLIMCWSLSLKFSVYLRVSLYLSVCCFVHVFICLHVFFVHLCLSVCPPVCSSTTSC